MSDRNLRIRGVAVAIMTIIFYAVGTTAAGAFQDAVKHLKHPTLPAFQAIVHRAEHGRYLLSAITHPDVITNLALGAVAAFVVWQSYRIFRAHRDTRKKYKQRHGYASHGTSHWQEEYETKQLYYKDNRGILLGDYHKSEYRPLPQEAFNNPRNGAYGVHPFTSQLNQQYIVFGPPGSLKTTGFVMPNIFHSIQQGLSLVATDPKGELYDLTASYAKAHGYKVLVLDYLYFKYGHRQNLLNYIYSEEQYAELASMYLNATLNEGEKKDFWFGKAQELLTALIGYVHQVYGEKGTFTHVYELFQHVSTAPDYVLNLFIENQVKGAPMLLIKGILAGSKAESMMSSVVGTISEKINLFTLSNVRAQTSTTDFDLARIADEKTIVYVWMSDAHTTYSPIVSVFWTVLFNSLYERARKSGGRLPRPVQCLMDEMGNIGKIADWGIKLTTMRSRQIYPMMIWHSYPQLKMKYGQDYADAIMAACDTHILLACNDMQTAKLFSESLGDTTIETESRRNNRSHLAAVANETSQFTGRKLLQPSEIKALDRRFSIIIQSGLPPVLLNKLQYRYWEYEICPPVTKEDLPMYVLGVKEQDAPSQRPVSVSDVAADLLHSVEDNNGAAEHEDGDSPQSKVTEVAEPRKGAARFL